MIYICQPNEVLIFSGPRRRVEGRVVGYRIIKGGLGLRIPMLETVDRMDLTNLPIEVTVEGAYSKGGIPLHVDAVANIKIAGEGMALANAIERFLGKGREEIAAIARETLEGNLRGVLAQLTPEQVNEDKISFAKSLQEEAIVDLNRLGIDLDNLKIQNITDMVGYLDSIGRRQSAELQKRSLIAEAVARADAVEKDAANQKETALAKINAQMQMVGADTEKRILDATTKKEAMVAEQRSQVEALIAKADAQLTMQVARIEQVRQQLEADMIQPAIAERNRMIEQAKAEAAPILEQGKASVTALEEAVASWQKAGDNARDVFLINKIEPIMRTMLDTIQSLDINQLTLLQSQTNGDLAMSAVGLNEKLKAALGIDLTSMLSNIGSNKKATEIRPSNV
ncbi:MAG: flotillin family protein [Deltaproteobacteria bacterium]|nr:flotillin family protein [Deltaproteobacteria bacterium]